jgi:hypothetical protein
MEATMRPKLTYANVIATAALFLALGGGAIAASHLGKNSVGSKQLKKNAVTTAKIKKNAVTTGKIKANAITSGKIKDGAVTFADLGAGTSLVGTATGGPVAADQKAILAMPLAGTTSFTPQAGSVYFLSVEAKGALTRAAGKTCEPAVIPVVNGDDWEVAEGFLSVRLQEPSADDPTGKRLVSGETGPLGMLSPGVPQSIAIRVEGDSGGCAPGSTVSAAIAITQAK